MTRKHFKALAEALAASRPQPPDERDRTPVLEALHEEAMSSWRVSRDQIASMCKRDNPAFDRVKFYAACEE